jgi:hypothetical protein
MNIGQHVRAVGGLINTSGSKAREHTPHGRNKDIYVSPRVSSDKWFGASGSGEWTSAGAMLKPYCVQLPADWGLARLDTAQFIAWVVYTAVGQRVDLCRGHDPKYHAYATTQPQLGKIIARASQNTGKSWPVAMGICWISAAWE